jgi:hypothetical protein
VTEQPPGRRDAAADPEITDAEVAAAVRRLDELAGRPPEEHVAIYEHVHQSLHQALSDLPVDGEGADQAAADDEAPKS